MCDKQGIYRQIFDRKSISRNTTHGQSLNLEAMLPKQDFSRSVGKLTLAFAFKNAVKDVNIACTLVVKKVKTRQRTAQKIAKIISHGERPRLEY